MRGLFIVLEGLDRSGKSTAAAALTRHLQSQTAPLEMPSSSHCVARRFPDRATAIGQSINAYLQSSAASQVGALDPRVAHLLFSANRWEAAQDIIHTLRCGTHVVCDRYAYSGVAFSAAQGLPFDWCKATDAGLPAPDLVLFLSVSPEVAEGRGGFGAERYETSDMQRRVREQFARIQAAEVAQTAPCLQSGPRWIELDANGSAEQVLQQAIGHVDKLLQHGQGLQPMNKLWV